MTEWVPFKLGQVSDVLVGFAFPSAQFDKAVDGTRLLRGANVHQGFIDWAQQVRWPLAAPVRDRYRLNAGDVVLAMDRPWIEAGLKRARLREADLPALLVQRVARLRGTGRARTSFIHHSLADQRFSRYLQSQVTGSTIPHISQSQIEDYPLMVPPLDVQDRICLVLDGFDDLIENNQRRVLILEKMARAIFRDWFVRVSQRGTRFIDDFERADWSRVPASTALVVNPQIRLDRTQEHPYVAMSDIDEQGMTCYPSQRRSSSSGARFQNGDTLFARITPSLQNGKTGYVQCLADGEVGTGSTELVVLRGRLVGPAFTYCLSRTPEFRSHAIASMVGASGRQRVRNECFDTFVVAVPPPQLAEKFERSVGPMFAQIDLLHREATSLAALRDLLLPKLVTGQVDVSTLDFDALIEEQVG